LCSSNPPSSNPPEALRFADPPVGGYYGAVPS
jgi:hypothetical protein